MKILISVLIVLGMLNLYAMDASEYHKVKTYKQEVLIDMINYMKDHPKYSDSIMKLINGVYDAKHVHEIDEINLSYIEIKIKGLK